MTAALVVVGVAPSIGHGNRAVAAPAVDVAGARHAASYLHVVAPRTVFGGRRGTRIAAGAKIRLAVAGLAGLADRRMTAAVLQVATSHATRSGSVWIWRTGTARPSDALFSDDPAHPTEHTVTVGVGASGRLDVRLLGGSSDLRIDLLGYYSPARGASLVTMPSTTAFDTRAASRVGTATRLTEGDQITERVIGRGVPASATAVVLDLETVKPARSGWVTVSTGGARGPLPSTTYAVRGRLQDVTTVVAVDRHGRITIGNHAGALDVVGNIEGYFTLAPTAGADPFVPVTQATVFDDPALRVAATEDARPSALSTVPATGVRAIAAIVHMTRPAGSTPAATAITSYADCAGQPAMQVPRTAAADAFAVIPLTPEGTFTVDNSVGQVAVRVTVLGYYPATSPVTDPCIAVTDFGTKHGDTPGVEIFDAQHFAHWSDAPSSPSLKMHWQGVGSGLAKITDVKLREANGHQYMLVASATGTFEVLAYPDVSHVLLSAGQFNLQWHGIEMLPNGMIAVAVPTSDLTRGQENGAALLYYPTPTGWTNEELPVECPGDKPTPWCSGELSDGHEVLWDPHAHLLWGLGLNHLVSWSIRPGPPGTAPTIKERADHPVGGEAGHDLQPVLGHPDLMWVSQGKAGIHLFSKQPRTGCSLTTPPSWAGPGYWCTPRHQNQLQDHAVKSISSRPGDREIIETWTTGTRGCTSTVHLFTNTDRRSHRTVKGTCFYRARWWDHSYT